MIHSDKAEKVAVKIIPATQQNLAATNADPQWQTDWESEYLADPAVDKFAMKLADGELLALGAYQVSGRKAYVYILYVESAPQSNPMITSIWHRRGDDRFRYHIFH